MFVFVIAILIQTSNCTHVLKATALSTWNGYSGKFYAGYILPQV